MKLTHTEAQAVMIAATGLNVRRERAANKRDVLEAIRRMSALQIDTIHVVARSPYLVLWSRLGDYEPRLLDELLAEAAVRVLHSAGPAPPGSRRAVGREGAP